MVTLAFSCSKDTAPDSLLEVSDPVPEFRDLIAAGAENVPNSDLLYCWYEVFECHTPAFHLQLERGHVHEFPMRATLSRYA